MTPLPQQDHPIWRIINLAVVFCGVTMILYVNASDFDETEWTAIIGVISLMGGYESLKHFVAIPKSKVETKKEDDAE